MNRPSVISRFRPEDRHRRRVRPAGTRRKERRAPRRPGAFRLVLICGTKRGRIGDDDADRCRAGRTSTHAPGRACAGSLKAAGRMDTLCLLFLCSVRTPGLGVRDTIPRVVISKLHWQLAWGLSLCICCFRTFPVQS